jgi:hypothetical protein
MKPTTTNQEIILSTGTRFSNRELCHLDSKHKIPKFNSPGEELEMACWAGMLFEMLPELTKGLFTGSKVHIWDIHSSKHCLLINQGTGPHPVENAFSLNPHSFLNVIRLN